MEYILMSGLEHKTRGAAFIFAGCGFFCIAGSLIKFGSYIGVYKLAFFRFVIGLFLVAAVAMSGRARLAFNNKKLLFLRGLAGGTAVFIGILSITKLGLGKGMVLVSSYPIFASIFGAIFLKERLRAINAAAILTAMVGIYFIAYKQGRGFTLFVFGKYELLAVLGAAISGVAITCVRKLHETDNSPAIYFAQCAVGMWLVIIPAFRDGTIFGLSSVFILLGMGVSVTIGQLLATQGMKYVPVKIGSLLLLLDPVLCFIAGVVIFGETPAFTCLLGSALVVGSCAAVLAGRKA
jgi:drug/metabolite transporter (DMT)-like permease